MGREVGWEEMGLEGGGRQVCFAGWAGVFCDGVGRTIEEGVFGAVVLARFRLALLLPVSFARRPGVIHCPCC